MISECSIAWWLAALKSLQSTEEPVAVTLIPSPDNAASGFLRSSAARTMLSGSALAPASRTSVRPSRLTVIPGCGWTTPETR